MTEPVDLDAVAELQAALAVNAELREALEDDSRLNLQDAARLRAENEQLRAEIIEWKRLKLAETDAAVGLRAQLADHKTFLASAHKKIDESEAAIDRAYKDGYDTGKMHRRERQQQ